MFLMRRLKDQFGKVHEKIQKQIIGKSESCQPLLGQFDINVCEGLCLKLTKYVPLRILLSETGTQTQNS